MSYLRLVASSSLALLAVGAAVAAPPERAEFGASRGQRVDPRLQRLLERLPLAYEVNRGQAPEAYDFLVRCRGYHAFVASDEVMFSFGGAGLRMSLDDAARCEPVTTGLQLSGRANYFLGSDPKKWVSDVPLTRGASYPDAAPGTTWTFGGAGRALEFVFDLAPGVAGPTLRLDGALSATVAADGSLRVAMPRGIATISAPLAWQESRGTRIAAGARWVVAKDGAVRIDVSVPDATCGVRIDPTVAYESYLGTSGDDYPAGAAIDVSGAPYFATKTNSASFPLTNGSYDATLSGLYDCAITKVNSSGSALVYSTYLGGTGEDGPVGIDVDVSGNAYVAGYAQIGTFPTTSGVYRTTSATASGFLTELNQSGSGLVFSTFTQSTIDVGPVIGPAGSLYIVEGNGVSSYTAGGVSQSFHRQIMPTSYSGIQVSMNGLAVDSAGDAYVAGGHGTTTFSATTGAYQTTLRGNSDAYVTKVSSTGTLVYTTFLGGSQNDSATGVGVNWQGDAFVVGNTTSSDYPVTSDGLSASGGAVATRLDATGSSIRFSTRLGYMTAYAIRAHPSGAFVVAGDTQFSQVPITSPFQASIGGGNDLVLMKFNPERTLAWCSYWGGSGYDAAVNMSLSMAPNGSVVVTGGSTSDDLPTVNAYQSQRVGASESIHLVIPDTLPTTLTNPVIGSMTLPDWTVNRPYSQAVVPNGGLAPYAFTVVSGNLPPGTSLSSPGVLSGMPTQTGTFTFNVSVTDVCEKTGGGSVTVKISPAPAIPSATLQGWTVGVPCNQPIPVTGGTAPFAFVVTSGAPPAGLTLTGDGRLTGTPTDVATVGFSVQATDAAGATASRSVSFRVSAAPSVNAVVLPACTETRTYSFQLTTTEGTAPFTWMLVSGSAPAPFTASGKLEGTTRQAGDYSFTVRATDAAGVSAERSFDAVSNPLPQIVTSALPPAAAERPYDAHLAVTGGTAPFVWSVQSGTLPVGITLEESTGALHGDLASAGGGPVTFRATDACGALALRVLQLDAAGRAELSGGKSSAKLTFAGDVPSRSVRYLEAVAGATIGISAKGGSQDGVLPTLVLTDPDGQVVDLTQWTKATAKAITVKGFPAPTTGRYFVTFTPAPGFSGKAKLSVSLKPRSAWSSGATLTLDETSEYAFSAPPGAKLSIVVKAEKGSAALPRIVSLTDAEDADLLASGTVTEGATTAVFKATIPLAGGDYRVVFGTRDGTSGPVTCNVKLKLPKAYEFALPDVAAGD
jgi:hypothetical protein